MGFKHADVPSVKTLLAMAGVALAAWGTARGQTMAVVAGALLLVAAWAVYVRGLGVLREKCGLILEAMRNNDFTFRFPTERRNPRSELILQDTLNRLGGIMGELRRDMEQRESFYEQILRSVDSGIVVINGSRQVVKANEAAARLMGLPVLVSLTQIDRLGEEVSGCFAHLQPGGRSRLSFDTPAGRSSIAVSATATQLGGETVRVLVLNDIRHELERTEVDSWVKLTRVLTHEIMNSVAPIISLSSTFMQRPDVRESPIYPGICAIHHTTEGLVSFVDSYRKFASLQKIEPRVFLLKELLGQVLGLDLVPAGVHVGLQVDPADLLLFTDPNLLRQIMINLLKNAVQAMDGAGGRILIHAYADAASDHIYIEVSNNGPAIPPELAGQIFVPFFTTKADGGGIGLSLSRQIMTLAGGSITLMPAGYMGWNTTFTLEFP